MTTMRKVAIASGGLLVLICGLALAGWVYLHSSAFRDSVAAAASGLAGRDVQIGALSFDPGWRTTLNARKVSVANADWAAEDGPLLRLEQLQISLRLLPLLRGDVELPRIVLVNPDLQLRRQQDGTVNWNLRPGAEAAADVAAPEEREEFPHIGEFRVEDGRVRLVDAVRGLALDGDISTAEGEALEERRLSLDLTGALDELPLRLRFIGGSLEQLHRKDVPYPVNLRLSWGDTHLAIDGSMREPLALADFDLTLTIEGPSMSKMFPVLQVPLPPTPPYRLNGRIGRSEGWWKITDFSGEVGQSDLAGEVKVDDGDDKPVLTATLNTQRLHYRDLGGFIGLDPGKQAENRDEASSGNDDDGIFPTTPLADRRLHAMNMDVRWTAAEVVAPDLQIQDLKTRIRLRDGVIDVAPLNLKVAGGTVDGTVQLSAQDDIPVADARLNFADFDLKPFFADTRFVQEMGGRFSGQTRLKGRGHSLQEMLQGADGSGWIGIRDGTISGLLVEGAGLDLAEALVLAVGGDGRVPLHCGRIDAEVTGGIAKISRALVDTSDSLVLADGNVNLSNETLDLRLGARAKDFSLIDLSAPVLVRGTLADPDIAIGEPTGLPFLELGEDIAINCDALLSSRGKAPADD